MRTTRTERRGLESERRTEKRRRRELLGACDAESLSVEDELGGRTRSASAASFRAFCRRRWGRSSVRDGVGFGGRVVDVSFSAAIDPSPAIVEVRAPLLAPTRVLSNKEFAEKYPAHSRGLVPVMVALTFDVLENFFVTDRLVDFVAV